MSSTYNERFTEDEWFLLVSLPSMIGAAVSGAAKSGVLGTVKEAMANVKAVMGAKDEYAGNPLIQSLIVQTEDREEAKATLARFNEMAKAKLENRGVKSPEQLIEVMLDDCGRAVCDAIECPNDGIRGIVLMDQVDPAFLPDLERDAEDKINDVVVGTIGAFSRDTHGWIKSPWCCLLNRARIVLRMQRRYPTD